MPYTYEYPRPSVTADAAIFHRAGNSLSILLIKRGKEPFKGMWALPGGFLDMNETLEEAVVREVKEETSLEGLEFEQFHTFSSVHRDPRHRTITTVFIAFVDKNAVQPVAGDDAGGVKWFDTGELPPLAFDHEKAIHMAVEKCLQ